MERIKNELPALPDNCRLLSDTEEYKECIGYAVDIHGKIWTCKEHNFKKNYFKDYWRELRLKNSRLGYPFFIASNYGKDKTIKVHRAVGFCFIPNPDNYPIINHIDGNKANNHVSNLEWCTHKHNCKHCLDNGLRNTARGERIKHSILKDEDIVEIFSLKKKGLLNKEIAAIFNIELSGISRILNRKYWAHVNVPS